MKRFFDFIRNLFRKQITFSVFAGILVIVSLIFIVRASAFLISNLNRALGVAEVNPSTVKFDIEGFEKLNFGK